MPAHHRSVPVPLVVLALLGLVCLLGAVGVLLQQRRALHSKPTSPEVTSHLKALYLAAGSYFLEKDVYTDDMGRLGFMPEPRNRYTYFSAAEGRSLAPPRRAHPAGPYQVVPGDPEARGYRGGFSSFAQTGCPLTPALLPGGLRAGLGVTPGPDGAQGQAVFIGAAAANIDDDTTVDCWSIATVDRVASDGTPILKGTPYNERSDVEH